jgi:hypothetical protein
MEEAYGRVIDLLMSGSVNHQSISVALAKSNPEAFLAIRDHVSSPAGSPVLLAMNREAMEMIRNGRFVDSVRFIRSQTGWGLKEAKDYCDGLKDTSSAEGKISRSRASLASLGDILKKTTQKYADEGTF